jgi:magnesium chelatase subunit D
MTQGAQAAASWADAGLAAALCAIDRPGLAGFVLRAGAGPVRDLWLDGLRALLPPGVPWRRLPLNVPDSRLLGGLDLVATLRAGRPVTQPGVLVEANGGALVVAGIERMGALLAARLAAVTESRTVAVERSGVEALDSADVLLVGLDESGGDEGRPPHVLMERLAFHLDLEHVSIRDVVDLGIERADIERACDALPRVEASPDLVEALCASAAALGIHSLRAPLFALRAARGLAALEGSSVVTAEHAAVAGRLVYASRAMQLPVPADEQEAPESTPPPSTDEAQDGEPRADRSDAPLEDLILASVQAAMPAGLLARLQIAAAARSGAADSGKAGAEQRGGQRGRPAGVRRGDPRRGARLDVIETLRAAAPWQTIRRRLREAAGDGASRTPRPRIEVRKDDFRIKRYIERARTTTIFAVDASGSAAIHRLGEAKGAVELLLGECYVRRDRVALVAFRGKTAEVVLPPTRSLVRAKRALAGLPGGGGTPLATGIDVAVALADATRRQGDSAVLVFLTDGRANIGRDGRADRTAAESHALAAARRVRTEGHAAIFVDTAPRPQPLAGQLAREMNARYVPLPNAGSRAIDTALRQALDD